jgi:acylphosphatase
MPLTRLRFVVKGRVQGVGFRWFVRGQAERLGLSGWVRNREDAAVEGEAEGDSGALEALLVAMRTGHPLAEVTGLETEAIAATGETTFDIRR